MTTNSYFADLYTATAADQVLYNDLIVESIQVHGRDFAYLPRTLTNFDSFFGEDALSAFNDIATVEMYLENVSGWEGDEKFLSKFGMEIRDEATLIVAKSRFEEEVYPLFHIHAPREGDIVVFPPELDHRVRAFEISYVEGESVFYQLGELYVWKLKVRNFEYNGESFDTGHSGIDSYDMKNSIATVIDLSSGSGIFSVGENVVQDNWSATVVMFDGATAMLTVNAVVGLFDESMPVTGESSGAVWTVDDVVNSTSNDPIADNKLINDSGIVNFSEKNPFSGI